MSSPFDGTESLEQGLRQAFWSPSGRSLAGFFASLRRVPQDLLEQAILERSIVPIVESSAWRSAYRLATHRVSAIQEELAVVGFRSGFAEAHTRVFNERIPLLAENLGRARAIELIQAVDRATRENIGRQVRSAAARYARSPSLTTTRDLARSIRPLIGLTPAQASLLRRRERRYVAAGLTPEAVEQKIRRQAERMIELRAAAIADRGIVETINGARQEAWVQALQAGEIPAGSMKAWRDQGDERVRKRHRQQTEQGPIPLEAVFPVFGVQFPPAPEHGCRCWHILVIAESEDSMPPPAPRRTDPETPKLPPEVVREAAHIVRGILPNLQDLDDALVIAERFGKEILEAAIAYRSNEDLRRTTLRSAYAVFPERVALSMLRATLPDVHSRVIRRAAKRKHREIFEALVNAPAERKVDLARRLVRAPLPKQTPLSGPDLRRRFERLERKDGFLKPAREAAHQLLFRGRGTAQITMKWERGSAPPARRQQAEKRWREARAFLSRMILRTGYDPATERPYEIFASSKYVRAYYEWRNGIRSGAVQYVENPAAVYVHEYGHHLESRLPELWDRRRRWLRSRTKGERATTIYAGTSEIGFKDEFRAHYVGKLYAQEWASEVLSMGLQYLFEDPVGFAKADPDMFDFILRILNNDWDGWKP